MFRNKFFNGWFFSALTLWFFLFYLYNDLQFLVEHWYYPAIMVLGAFVAGVTPEGGGAVAFPVLNIFLNIDRVMARDFSLMIQSVGMTSASIFILSHAPRWQVYKPVLLMIPVCFLGFVFGMQFMQALPVYIIQALFLSLITAFALVYSLSKHRGTRLELPGITKTDMPYFLLVLFCGGIFASLFGTGADIVLYTLLVTRLRMHEKIATHMAIMLMAAISILGYSYRFFVDDGLSQYQIQTWLCAHPVVLLMAPFGAFVLSKIDKELMLKGVAVLNVAQVCYFLLYKPSVEKAFWIILFSTVLTLVFTHALRTLSNKVPVAD